MSHTFYAWSCLLIVFLISVTSCDKKDAPEPSKPAVPIDTIFPGDYFPAYPGSFWIYDNNDTVRIENGWHQYAVSDTQMALLPAMYSSSIFPKIKPPTFEFSYELIYIKGYELSNDTSPDRHCHQPFQKILSEKLGESFVPGPYCDFVFNAEMARHESSVQAGGLTYNDVLVVDLFTTNGPVPDKVSSRYYARNIGLVKIESGDGTTSSNLVSFFINK